MATCKKCSKVSQEIPKVLSLCAECISKADEQLLADITETHTQSRLKFGLPASPPSDPQGIQCTLCQNQCKIPAGQRGYCSIRKNENGHLIGGTPQFAAVSWYYDPLPTNCVADWVCAGGTGAGYPKLAYQPGPERGYLNLAVFYEACTFNCLFCQNWHYRQRSIKNKTRTSAQLAESVTPETSCICFFGGDPPTSRGQLPHALAAAKLARKQNKNRILRPDKSGWKPTAL